jgi:hypothetical protein
VLRVSVLCCHAVQSVCVIGVLTYVCVTITHMLQRLYIYRCLLRAVFAAVEHKLCNQGESLMLDVEHKASKDLQQRSLHVQQLVVHCSNVMAYY